MTAVELVTDCGNLLGESALWHADSGKLFWLDLARPELLSWSPSSGELSRYPLDEPAPLGALVLSAIPDRLLLASTTGIRLIRLDGTEDREGAASLAHPLADREGFAYNDAAADAAGRLWVGTAELSETSPTADLFTVDLDGGVRIADGGFVVCNGPVFSADGETMYFSDTLNGVVLAYNVDSEGRASGRRVHVHIPAEEGLPDGMAIDDEGALWVAHWGGARITRWHPAGALLASIPIPALNVTSLAFGGARRDILFVTTAADPDGAGVAGGVAATPGSGALYSLDPGVSGPVGFPCLLGVE